METRDCLIEIGTEELPPLALASLSRVFAESVSALLQQQGFVAESVERFATPRRLAVLLRQLPMQQAEQRLEKRGPALQAAFDADGKPTRAALGFAASCGVEVDALERRETEKGCWLYFTTTQAGLELAECLADTVGKALAGLPIPKRMRWGAGDEEFVRPVKWVVMMAGGEVIEGEIFGLAAGNRTRGHRFHAPGIIGLEEAGEYELRLESEGKVVASFEKRRDLIRDQIERAAESLGGQAAIDDGLLDEVTALVEFPVAVCGKFDDDFLKLPVEVLVSTMQDNQKYFAVYDEQQRLLPRFITIANIDSRDSDMVSAGNERVIRPRFADAEFFFAQDKRQGLDEMRARLESVVFQEQLGSLWDKATRVTRLAKYIAAQTGANQDLVRRAAELCKADLMSDMVGEFPKLQGIMGRYYALDQQEDPVVCDTMQQHYWPRYAGDRLPQNEVAQAVALADRLDSLVGIFAIGQKPGGDKDPFALRRAALGVLRILIESELNLDLLDLCRSAADGYYKKVDAEAVIDDVIEYIHDRLRAYFEEQGVGYDIVDAVTHDRSGNLYDCARRIQAVTRFQQHESAAALAAANKRIANILKKQASSAGSVDSELLREAAEQALWQQMQALDKNVSGLYARGDYLEALEQLAELRPAVDRFFDDVMVLVEDESLKNNRLALLDQLLQSFRKAADFARIQA